MEQGRVPGRSACDFSLVFLLTCAPGLLLSPLLRESPAEAACSVSQAPSDADRSFVLHLGNDCSQQDREAHAVKAGDLLSAIAEGKEVDLAGVVVTGDVLLDQLPLRAVSTLPSLPLPIQEAIQNQRLKEVRVITGPLSMRDSVVRGAIGTKSKDGLLIVKGPVTMTGTTFERAVDFSQTTFAAPVDFSQAVLLKEGFFIHALFTQTARFEKTAFGVHSRFHRARFLAPVTYQRAGFNGLAEFIQVTFDKEASFAQTYFTMGTGFSGSRFKGMADFSEAVFERDVFFMFAVFEQDAYFRRVTFRDAVDFSDSEFQGLDDFSKAFFNEEPRFTRAKVSGAPPRSGGMQDPRVLYIIAAALFAFTLIFVFILRKG